jgi:hypothetical protein
MTNLNGMQTQIIVTMAGFGRRFLDAGYTQPKYQIEAHGRSLFFWSLLSLRNFAQAGATFHFIARAADKCRDFIARELTTLGISSWQLLELDKPTDGQATTALLALPKVDQTLPFLVYNIDTFVEPDSLRPADIRGDGWVPCFPGIGDAWSFARTTGHDGVIAEIREKQRISEHATIGLYWFRSGTLYADLYQRFYATTERQEAGERYIAPMYNQLIDDGGQVYLQPVPFEAVHPLGTPLDVSAFKSASAPRQ